MHACECEPQTSALPWDQRSTSRTLRDHRDLPVSHPGDGSDDATTRTRGHADGEVSVNHVCRVSSAQMLTRRGFPLDTVAAHRTMGEATPSRCMCRKPQYIDRGDHETTTGSRNGRTLSRNSSNKVLGCQHDHHGSPPPWSLGDFDRQRTLALHLWMALWISWSSTGIQRACRTEVQAMF